MLTLLRKSKLPIYNILNYYERVGCLLNNLLNDLFDRLFELIIKNQNKTQQISTNETVSLAIV